MPEEDRTPFEWALDAALHLPVGVFLDTKDRWPELTEKGRQHVESQIKAARMIGELVVSFGTKELAKRVGRFLAGSSTSTDAARPGEQTTTAPAPDAASSAIVESGKGDGPSTAPKSRARSTARPARPVRLPIDGYDTLAASQVIARLDALAPVELEAIGRYEAGHRNRKTILGRIAQLQRS